MALQNAESHLIRRVLTAAPNLTVADVRAILPGEAFESLARIYLVDDQQRLQGAVPLVRLLPAPDSAVLRSLATISPAIVRLADDEEHVATIAFESGQSEVAVVDESDRFVGVVPAATIIGILRHEHIEDMRRMAGVLAHDRSTRLALEASPVARLYKRLPWLLVGLAGSFAATTVMRSYEELMRSMVTVAVFVPAIVYLADAIGTQTEAAAVRYLSFGSPQLRKMLSGEVLTGLLIGVCLAAISIPVIALAYGDLRLATAVGIALACSATIATTIAILLPWFLWRSGSDPALGSGPVATIVQDVLSLLIYFATVTALLTR
jgi:magnesium transporter